MTLEDILKIDTCPFDDSVLDKFFGGDYNGSVSLQANMCNLILRYLNLFWRKYQPEMVRAYSPQRLVGVYDGEEDDYCFWVEEASDIMHTAVSVNGWECVCLNYESGDIKISDHPVNYGDAENEPFHKAYMEYLDECGVKGFVRKIFEKEEKKMRDAAFYADNAILGILLNEKLTAYNAFKKRNPDWVQTVCKEEDLHISKLEHDIWQPFLVCFVEEKRKCKGVEYGVFLLGCDGYSYFGFDNFDPNWVCKTFVMDQLLDIALGKMEAYIAAKKSVA